MPPSNQKDWSEITIDFACGAAISDIAVFFGILDHYQGIHLDWHHLGISLVATTLIAGPMAALFRDYFWIVVSAYFAPGSDPDSSPIKEFASPQAKIVLWGLFAIGCIIASMLFIG